MERNSIRQIVIAILAVLLALFPLSGTTIAEANGILPIPHAFYGNLYTTGGESVPAGIVVTATVNGVTVVSGPLTTNEVGKYGGPNPGDPKLIVQGSITDGAPIEFYVEGVLATPGDPDKAKFYSGTVTKLDLTYTPTTSGGASIGGGGGGVVGGGGGIPASTTTVAGRTDVSNIVDSQGVLTQNIAVQSEDTKTKLVISKDTVALSKGKEPLSEITIVEIPDPPVEPDNSAIVGLTHDLGPDGATFEPPITFTFNYNPEDIPAGTDEKELVIAYWSGNEWIVLEGSSVDTVNHIITAPISHFTIFTILVYQKPAMFTISDLRITPGEAEIKEQIAISFSIANSGDLSDTYNATLRINNVVEATKEVTLAGGTNQSVTFNVAKNTAGTYTVDIAGHTGTFKVKEKVAPSPTPGPVPTPTPSPTPSLAPIPTPSPTPSPSEPIKWPILGGVIATVVIVGLLISFLSRRRAH
ncbi:CARDB domain-containing protein [Chloroflexota bacterium]